MVHIKSYDILLLVLVILCVCTACDNRADIHKSTLDATCKDQINDKQVNTLKKNNRTVPISIFFYGTKPEDTDEVLKEVENRCELDIELDFKWERDMPYSVKITDVFERGKLDAFCPDKKYVFFEKKLAAGEIKDISKLLPKYAPNIYRQLKKEEALNSIVYKDKGVLLPTLNNQPNKILVSIEDKYVKKYDIKSIDTLEQYIDILRQIKEDSEDLQPVYFDSNLIEDIVANISDYISVGESLLYKWDDPNMKLIPLEKIAEFSDIALLISKACRDKIFTYKYNAFKPHYSTIYMDDHISNIEDRHLRGAYNPNEAYETKKLHCTFALYPGKRLPKKNSLCNSFVFPQNSKHTEETLRFLDWVQSERENYDILNYGINEEHYKLVEDEISIIKPFTVSSILFSNTKYIRKQIGGTLLDRRQLDNKALSTYAPHYGIDREKKPNFGRYNVVDKYLIRPIVKVQYENIKQLANAIKNIEEEANTAKAITKYNEMLLQYIATKNQD